MTEPLFHWYEKLGAPVVMGLPTFTLSTLNCTEAIVAVEEVALAVNVIGPTTVAAGAGLVTLTAGGVFETVTETAAEVVLWFWVSVAMAVRICVPLVRGPVDHCVEKLGPEPFTVAMLTPSARN